MREKDLSLFLRKNFIESVKEDILSLERGCLRVEKHANFFKG
jgi:hypothetical protein